MPKSAPTAAPHHWPYLNHRTVAEVDGTAMTPIGKPCPVCAMRGWCDHRMEAEMEDAA